MKIAVPREVHSGEQRVATTPEVVTQLLKLGFEVNVEKDAGVLANFADEAYIEAGAGIVADTRRLWAESDIVLKVRAPEHHPGLDCDEVSLLREGHTLIAFIWPAQQTELMARMAASGASVLAMDSVPRISRAQKMDALSSMANIGGYRAVVEAAGAFRPILYRARLRQRARCRRRRSLVHRRRRCGPRCHRCRQAAWAQSCAHLIRVPEVKEQVESMDAEFLMLEFEEEKGGRRGWVRQRQMSEEFIEAEMALFAEQAREVDIIITTALIPGKPCAETDYWPTWLSHYAQWQRHC